MCQLYLISPPVIDDLSRFSETLDAALSAGGVGAFQLRLKQAAPAKEAKTRLTLPAAPDEVILKSAETLIPVCRAHDVALIVNDSPMLAKAAGADGVHLGQEDGDIAAARALLGEDAAIGVTCHASRHLAMEAGEQGADYVAFGAFFPTTSKTPQALERWGTPDISLLEWWSAWTTVPCVAIGGITPDNCAPLVRAGADFLAVITAVWEHPQGPQAAVQAFRKAITSA